MAYVTIDAEKCKGCGICIVYCRTENLVMSEERNASGAPFPLLLAEGKGGKACTGCAYCAIVCPDICFEVWREKKKKKKMVGGASK